jgi:SAM-dependent methyltransferase
MMTKQLAMPTSWDQLPSGDLLHSVVEQTLLPWWQRIFGYHLLKVGCLSQTLNTSACPIHHQIDLDSLQGNSLQAEPAQMPFKNHSIDACLLSCLLDFHPDPLRVLREVDRCLVPAGHIVFVGFNPLSPLILGEMLPQYRSKFPWCGHSFTPARMKDWLNLLGYQVVHDERLIYHHLLTQLELNSRMQRMLESLLPTTGALYIVIARKLNVPLTAHTIKDRRTKKMWLPAAQAQVHVGAG